MSRTVSIQLLFFRNSTSGRNLRIEKSGQDLHLVSVQHERRRKNPAPVSGRRPAVFSARIHLPNRGPAEDRLPFLHRDGQRLHDGPSILAALRNGDLRHRAPHRCHVPAEPAHAQPGLHRLEPVVQNCGQGPEALRGQAGRVREGNF